jgi:HAD superfamily hydrolase (TIGR01509 family)
VPRHPALLLDVMDNLVHDPFYAEVLDFFGMGLEELFAVKSKRAWVEFECGWLHEEQMRSLYFEDGRELDLEGLRACMRANYRLLPGIEEILRELHAEGVEMHALSNYPIWYRMIEEVTGLSRWLKWSFVSCKTQIRKPDPRSFLGAAMSLGRRPTDCVFVDDREKNCQGARKVGLTAIHFQSAASLRGALRELGYPLS